MRPKRQKPKRAGFGNRQFGRQGGRQGGSEFGRQIDADLTEAQDAETETSTVSDLTLDDSTEFTGADFPEVKQSQGQEEKPVITHAMVRERAVRLLVNREHGRIELEQKLLQRELPPDLIVSVLDQLEQEGLQCDSRFAESYLRMRVDRGYGANKVRADLQSRRLEQSIIEDAIRDHGADWTAVARDALDKKFGRFATLDLKARAKMQRFLYQRGFAAEEIRSAMSYFDNGGPDFEVSQ